MNYLLNQVPDDIAESESEDAMEARIDGSA
jgi:hypothetical protein